MSATPCYCTDCERRRHFPRFIEPRRRQPSAAEVFWGGFASGAVFMVFFVISIRLGQALAGH